MSIGKDWGQVSDIGCKKIKNVIRVFLKILLMVKVFSIGNLFKPNSFL